MQDDARGGTKRRYTSIVKTVKLMVKEEGVSALYKGVDATAFRQAGSAGLRFMTYEYVNTLLRGSSGESQSWHSFTAGAAAGFVSAVLNNPIDVIKTRLQRQEVT